MSAGPTRPQAQETPPAATVLDRMLGRPPAQAGAGSLLEDTVATWTDTAGTLADGRSAGLAASCLLRPAPGDRVLIWSGEGGRRWVLDVLGRADDTEAVLALGGAATITAERIALAADAVHIQAEDFLTSTRNRHAVEDVRTETVNTRVAQIGTDIRRASHATDQVEGTVLQRAGTWISNTVKEARLHARAFLFD